MRKLQPISKSAIYMVSILLSTSIQADTYASTPSQNQQLINKFKIDSYADAQETRILNRSNRKEINKTIRKQEVLMYKEGYKPEIKAEIKADTNKVKSVIKDKRKLYRKK